MKSIFPDQLLRFHRRFLLAFLLGAGFAHSHPPKIFRALDPVRPDETLLLFGANFTPGVTAEGQRLPDDRFFAPSLAGLPPSLAGPGQKLEVLQATDLSAKVLIPGKWKPGVYAVRLRNADGSTPWMLINRPVVWWCRAEDAPVAAPGGEVRIFGLNFGSRSRAWLVNKRDARALAVLVARENDLAVRLPADLPAGDWRLVVHSGLGGESAGGEPFPLRVETVPLRSARIYSARDFGARGDDETDDTAALRAALARAAKDGGGVVILPAGSYLVSGKIVLPLGTGLRGEGTGAVWIKTARDAEPFDALFAGEGDFTLENFSVLTRAVRRVVASPDSSGTYVAAQAGWGTDEIGRGAIRLAGLRIRHLLPADKALAGRIPKGETTIALCGPRCEVVDCDIVSQGMPLQLGAARQALVRRCRLATGRGGWVGLWKLEEGLFEENEITGADLSGSYGSAQGFIRDVCFRGNRWHGAFGGDNEALTFDTPYEAAWSGPDFVAAGTVLTLGQTRGRGGWPPNFQYPLPLQAVIVGGRGLGQSIPVEAIDDRVLRLARPFSIAPDASSVLAVVTAKTRVLVVDNEFADASVAVQLYSQAESFFIARNHAVRTGGAYACAGDSTTRDGCLSYAFFNQWIDNRFEEGAGNDLGPFRSGYVGLAIARPKEQPGDSTPAIGNRFVGNQLLGGTRMGAIVAVNTNPTGPAPAGRDAIFEANRIVAEPVGITLGVGESFNLARKNIFERVARPYRNDGAANRIFPPALLPASPSPSSSP